MRGQVKREGYIDSSLISQLWKFFTSQSYISQNRMGQCLPEVSGKSYQHPSLGLLQKQQLSGASYYITVRQMDDQQSYICWSKKLNKMRSFSQLKNFLYLPVKQLWKGGSDASSGGELQLFFEPYQLTLFEMVMSHKLTKTYPKQSFLWELCYSILRYLHSFKQIQYKQNSLSFQNIVVDYKGSVKIISDTMIADRHTNFQLTKKLGGRQSSYEDEDEEIQLAETTFFIPKKQRCSLLHVSGVICLSTAALLDLSHLSQNNHLAWRNMSQTVKKEALRKCKDTYSDQLIQVLKDMISSTKVDNFAEIIRKIEIFMPEVQLGCYDSPRDEAVQKDNFLPLKIPKMDQMKSLSECHRDKDVRSTIQTIIFDQNENYFAQESYLTIL